MGDDREQAGIESKAAEVETRLPDDGDEEDDDEASSPFDHPAFLPALLWALALWFGYDGWLNSDPDMQEHLDFNRYGFGILFVGAVYYTFRAAQEFRERAGDGD